MVVTCKIPQCRYNNEGMCGAGFINIAYNGICEYLLNRDGSPRIQHDWMSDQKEKDFHIEYPEYVEEEVE